MILNFPTGLYETVLPQKPSDSENVTYTVSSTVPPRPSALFPLLSVSAKGRPRPQRVIPHPTRRAALGQLVFTITESSPSLTVSGTLQYETGQLLDFTTATSTPIDQPAAGPLTELRHDTNLLDLTNLGLTEDDQNALDTLAASAFKELQDQLNAKRSRNQDLQLLINNTQSQINEANKAIEAVEAIRQVEPTGTGILLAKLNVSLNNLQAQMDAQVHEATSLAVDIDELNQQLVNLSRLLN